MSMLIKRGNINNILKVINNFKDRKFNMTTQYKFIKIKKALSEESEIYLNQLFDNCKDFFEIDEKGEYKAHGAGGYMIKVDKVSECNEVIFNLDNTMAQIPDIYFSFEELQELDLSFLELETLECFIKE